MTNRANVGPLRLSVVRGGYIVIAILVSVVVSYRAIPKQSVALTSYAWDFAPDYKMGRAFAEGYNPYTPAGRVRAQLPAGPTSLGHPPSTVMWFVPLVTQVDLPTAHIVIGWLTAFAVLLELAALFSMLRAPAPIATTCLAFAYVLAAPLFVYHLRIGQISALIALLIFASWVASRRGDDVLAGLALGVACTLKLFPATIVLLFLVWRRWYVVAAAAMVYVAGFVFTAVWVGLSSWTTWLKVQGPIADAWVDSIQNQAVSGIVARLFHPACGPHGQVAAAGVALTIVLSVALVGACAWRASKVRTAEGRDVAFATFAVVSVVTSQWAWEHYGVLYILPVAVGAAALAAQYRRGERRRSTVALLAVLAGVVASWQIDVDAKARMQRLVREGTRGAHLQLHSLEVLNWLPGFALLAVLLILLWRFSATQPDQGVGSG